MPAKRVGIITAPLLQTNYNKKFLQIKSKIYYKLRQLKFPKIINDY